MKVDGQYPKVPLQDKSIQKGKEKEAITQKALDQKRAAELKNAKTSQFTVSKIKEVINTAEDVNLDKVKALKAKIDSGEYQIDKPKLVQKMLADSIVEDT